MSLGASLSIGRLLPLKFQISMLLMDCGGNSNALYTSLKRCKQLALSNSRLTYSTRPLAQSNPSHFLPSAIAIHSSIKANDLPALDAPEISIL